MFPRRSRQTTRQITELPGALPETAARVKGIAIRNFVPVIASLYDVDVAVRVLRAAPEDLAHRLESGGIVASGWYPLAWYCDLHDASQKVTGSGVALARRIGRESTRMDLTGIYRVFLRMVSPELVLSAFPRIFAQYYAPARVQIAERRRGYARVTFEHCTAFDRNIWNDVLGGCEVGLELAGATNVRIRIAAGGGAGETTMEAVAHWS